MNRYVPRIVRSSFITIAWCLAIAVFSVTTAFAQNSTGKLPVIIIPGLSGSELVNKKTGEVVWFKAARAKDDDIRLPVSGSMMENRDDLVTRDILRSIKIGLITRVDAYGGMAEALEKRGGYTEGNWDSPSASGDRDTFYVFPYDWRRDNVENAQILIRKIADLKSKLGKPELKFNIIGHSMGGIIARYAAMYGDADLDMGKSELRPTWAGARHIDRVILLGTPSEGSALSFSSLLNGFTIGGIEINIPFIQNPSKFDIFTVPAAYQLLPAPGTLKTYDENLKPMKVDIYDPKTWATYGWGAINDKDFDKYFEGSERANGKTFFTTALYRAQRLHEALAAAGKFGTGHVAIDVIGGNCKSTLDAVVIYRDKKTGWKTLFKPTAFTNSSGRKITTDDLSKLIMAPGDGVVAWGSLNTVTQSQAAGVQSILFPSSASDVCSGHNAQPANDEIQNKVIQIFASGVAKSTTTARERGFRNDGKSLYINIFAN